MQEEKPAFGVSCVFVFSMLTLFIVLLSVSKIFYLFLVLKFWHSDDDEDRMVWNVECHYAQANIVGCLINLGDCVYVKVHDLHLFSSVFLLLMG